MKNIKRVKAILEALENDVDPGVKMRQAQEQMRSDDTQKIREHLKLLRKTVSDKEIVHAIFSIMDAFEGVQILEQVGSQLGIDVTEPARKEREYGMNLQKSQKTW